MSTITSYELDDHLEVEEGLLASPTLGLAEMRVVAGDGWMGFFDAGEYMDPPPEPSQSLAHPTMWIRWRIEYEEEPRPTLDPDGPVYREGAVRLALRYQAGARRGRALRVFKQIREAAMAANAGDGELVYFPESRSFPRPPEAGWPTEELTLIFKGT